jgi:hypothetical protein
MGGSYPLVPVCAEARARPRKLATAREIIRRESDHIDLLRALGLVDSIRGRGRVTELKPGGQEPAALSGPTYVKGATQFPARLRSLRS